MADGTCWIYRAPATTLPAWQVLRRVQPALDLCVADDSGALRLQLPPGLAPLPVDQLPPGTDCLQAERTRVIAGPATGQAAPWHYVVETDVLPAFEDEFNAWYDTEHLPGLASVPGVVQALRLRRLDGRPVYHACYDLAQREAFNSPPWLAVRSTPWSDRVRAAFRDTRRVFYRRVLATD